MSIILVGFNHKTAPVEVRERFAFTDERTRSSLQLLVDNEKISEGLIISTCNRVEVLAALGSGDHRQESGIPTEEGVHLINRFFSSEHQIDTEFLREYSYTHVDGNAVRHVFRVASSLDSMVVGEPQVLGQVRHAYSLAVAAGTAGRILHRLVHHAFRVAKRVRNETGIAATAVSISYTAVELGRKIFGSLEGHTVLLVGAGEMAELAAKHLVNA
ncbi:MAG: glutamyl-tRNA reductase, partial [Pyrinomonadaceae bacterium]